MTRTRNGKANPFGIYIVSFVVCFILLGLNSLGLLKVFRSGFEFILIPPKRLVFSIKSQADDNIRILFTPNLETKLLEADESSRALDVLQSKIQLLEEENATLRAQLETPLPPSWDYIPSSVLGKDRYLIVDKGEKDGVEEGMVVVYKDIVVGVITRVNPRTSLITLPTDPDLKIPAKTNKNVKGLLTGIFGSEIHLTKILQKESINSFDTVLSSGEEGGVPPNLVIGKIREVISSDDDVFKEAVVDPLVDYDNLTHVFIVSSF